MTPDYCTHLPLAHDHPEKETDLYDNFTLLLSCVKALFEVISDATEGRDEPGNTVSDVAYLGGHLCKELERRVAALCDFQAAPDAQAGKEG